MLPRLALRRPRQHGQAVYDALVELHRVRRRFDVARLKHELRREALHTRRELDAELRQLDKRPNP